MFYSSLMLLKSRSQAIFLCSFFIVVEYFWENVWMHVCVVGCICLCEQLCTYIVQRTIEQTRPRGSLPSIQCNTNKVLCQVLQWARPISLFSPHNETSTHIEVVQFVLMLPGSEKSLNTCIITWRSVASQSQHCVVWSSRIHNKLLFYMEE